MLLRHALIAERALAHTGKTEVLLGGGVACNQRMRDMSSIMCQEEDQVATVPLECTA